MFRSAMFAGVVLIMPAQLAAADDARDEMKKLEGTWTIVNLEADGKTHLPKDFVQQGLPKKLKIVGDKIDSFLGGEAARISIDPKQKPKHLDLRNVGEKEADKWIYALDGDDLKLAVTFDLKLFSSEPADRSRPKSFETKGNKVIVINLKREKK